MECLRNTSFENGFNSVFKEINTTRKLELKNDNCLRFFYLDISNNYFDYSGLHYYLQKNIGRYVFSRATIEKYKKDGDVEAIGLKAIELLRKVSNDRDSGAGGELGEILLYLFLEQKLKAPKLLSKVELKTSPNQYVFGSDAIHLLPIDNEYFQLIFGEAKIKGKLNDGVKEAFKSIVKVVDPNNNEIVLVENNIFKESFSAKEIEYIESIILPKKRDRDINIDKAFGIFLGYTLDIDRSQYSNREFKDAVIEKICDDIDSVARYIEEMINKKSLSHYSFYFYILPFNDSQKDRIAIMKKLRGD